ncbi:MAG: response regulator, partial [Spirochaetia bacterium]|nr:response regulator [Spirochaetia bacterium]
MVTVLVVEDEAPIADTLEFALTREGFRVLRAGTVESAAGLLDQCALVILDVGLPDTSGFELLKSIRSGARGKSARLPVIMLTARAEEIDRILGLELGADDYVAKPFSPREVAARVKAVLRRAEAQAESSPFRVDESRSIVFYYGQSLALSPTEYKILSLLMRHPGWVFSRDKIMDLAYEGEGMDASLDRSVDTHIKNIRAKLRAIQPDKDPL